MVPNMARFGFLDHAIGRYNAKSPGVSYPCASQPAEKVLPKKSGIHGLLHLAGGSVARADAAALDLALPSFPTSRVVEGVDTRAEAVSRIDNAAGLTVLVGEIEDAEQLARSLSLPADASPAAIAQAALAVHGRQLPARMVGEYACVNVDRNGYVTLVQSAALRDPLHYSLGQGCLAVSSSALSLASLSWVGREPDLLGFATFMGRARTRPLRDNRTILRNVREVLPGETVRIAPGGHVTRSLADMFEPVPRFQGSRADALEAVEDLLLRIIGARMNRQAKPAILLSGGIDSSLLALFMARQRSSGQTVGAITSVAPPGSGLVDERSEAGLVAQTLDLDHHLCWPAQNANPYAPHPWLFVGRDGPLLSNRHALTLAMQETAVDCGATLLVNGTFGEGTATARLGPAASANTVAGRLRAVLRQVLHQFVPPEPEGIGFHARLAPDLLASLPASLANPPDPLVVVAAGEGQFGYSRAALKALHQPTELAPGAIRADYPFRDIRLLHLFASLPREFLQAEDGNREFARHLMSGHLPDAIRLRQHGRAASPDHLLRLRGFAATTRESIGDWRAMGVGDWVDLAWLDSALSQAARQEAGHTLQSTEVQITAMTATFLSWWLQGQAPH